MALKSKFVPLLWLCIIACFPLILFAQVDNRKPVLLKAGEFFPEENINSTAKITSVINQGLFNNKYYLVIQFKELPGKAEKEKLKAAGIQLIDYIPNNAYTATITKAFDATVLKLLSVRSVFQFTINQKTFPGIVEGIFPEHAKKINGYADVTVITFEKINADFFTAILKGMDASVVKEMPMFRSFTIRVAVKNIQQLLSLPFVQWVEPIDPPNQAENLLGRTLHRVNVLNDGIRKLKGDGINVGIWDGGQVSPHLDFLPAGRLIIKKFSDDVAHATHCAGTLAGKGIINPIARGMAPNAKLFSYDFLGDVTSEMFAAIPSLNLSVSSHSYGSSINTCGLTGSNVSYSSTSRSTDINLNTYPTHLHIHSAGNSQTNCTGGWSTISGSGKSAKNNIVVANITTAEIIEPHSSFGPVSDGRVKPEISAFGTDVFSTVTPLNAYDTYTGTSMSTPGVAGSVVLLVQRYKQLHNNNEPLSSLIKAVVCNTARDIGNIGPDYKYGFGRINALAAVKALEQNRYTIGTVATGETKEFTIDVPAGATKLKAMLTWNDPAGSINANPALVNNLDLLVGNRDATGYPWKLDKNNPSQKATTGIDSINNIEQVTIDNPTQGAYTITVKGTAIAVGDGQQFSLTWEIETPFIEITYPNGGESLAPGTKETITWDNAGITSNQTIQYSLNNGATWTTLSNGVGANTTRFVWTVPSTANTSLALVKVINGAITDISDASFKILGPPSNFATTVSCDSGTVNFSWTAVANATQYDILKLDTAAGEWNLLVPDITGTNYTATGLPPGSNMWFTIISKNSNTNAESGKAVAINKIVTSTSLSSINTITGQEEVFAADTNIIYSIPAISGASSYVWSLPPNAAIGKGAGTNSILVNYPANSASGKVAVYATKGVCSTSVASLAVNIILCNGTNTFYKSGQQGTSYQWQENKGGGYQDIINNSIYSGATTDSISLTAPPTTFYGYTYRCAITTATGIVYSQEYILKFGVQWLGKINTAWENAANWSCNIVPDNNTDVIIKLGTIVINSDITIRSIRTFQGVSLTVNSGKNFMILK